MAMHMRTTQRIRLSVSLQAPFSLCASPALCALLLARGRQHPRPWGRDAPRGLALCAGGSSVRGTRTSCSGRGSKTLSPGVGAIIVVADAGYAANVTLKRSMICTGPMFLPCRAPASSPTANMCATWCSISPKSAIVVGLRASPMDAAKITGCLCVTPSCISWAMSRSYYRKKRRNLGPKRVKIIVTNLLEASAGTILSHYAWRWGVELTIKELKSGLHLGRMQGTNDAE